MERIGMAAASPKGQRVFPSIFEANRKMLSISSFFPFPSAMRLTILFIHEFPIRQGVHWPHDSWE
jgi:hypothetical protein